MAKGRDKTARRRMRGSFLSTVLGIAMVLLMLGSLGLILLNAQKLSRYVKENIRFQIYLLDESKDVDVAKLQKSLDASNYVRETSLMTKSEAAEQLKLDLGEDFLANLDGVNPIPATLDIKLEADYTHPDSIEWIVNGLSQNTVVREVVYSPDLIAKVNDNMKRITLILLGFSALLLLIAIALINNTIRLSMYSKRFVIRSMQLVGATRSFIQWPFLWQGVVQGLMGGIIAMGGLTGGIYLLRKEIPDFFQAQDVTMFLKLFGLTVAMGVFIAFISTFFAVNRYIRMKLDDLY